MNSIIVLISLAELERNFEQKAGNLCLDIYATDVNFLGMSLLCDEGPVSISASLL